MSQAKPATGHDARGLPTRIRHAIWRHGKVLRQRILPRPVAQHVFVAGMQRSGTNLLMEVLDASADTQVFHETDPRVRVVFYEDLVRHPLGEVAAVYDFLGLQGFSQQVAGRIHARSVKHRSPPDIAPAVVVLCDELLARFRALTRQGLS